MHLKLTLTIWRPLCLGLNVIMTKSIVVPANTRIAHNAISRFCNTCLKFTILMFQFPLISTNVCVKKSRDRDFRQSPSLPSQQHAMHTKKCETSISPFLSWSAWTTWSREYCGRDRNPSGKLMTSWQDMLPALLVLLRVTDEFLSESTNSTKIWCLFKR